MVRGGLPSDRNRAMVGLALILIFAALAGFYSSARYQGWFADVDALIQAASAESIQAGQRLIGRVSYTNGFAYGALLAFIGQVSGLSPYLLVNWGNVWLAVFVLVAFITYRELLDDVWQAALGTLLLLMIPDLVFYVQRGGHERITWMLALLMIFLLARSLRYARQPGLLSVYIICFYLIFWAMAATNVYFASTFVNAIILSMFGPWVLGFLIRSRMKGDVQRGHFLRRLLLVSLACLILVFVFVNYTYRPALVFYNIAENLVNRLGILIFGVQEAELSASYAYVGKAWIDFGIYLVLVGMQFSIAALSFVGWVLGFRRQFSLDDRRWFLWWLYGAFGVLLVIGILADSGRFLQGNMQLRMFTPFALFVAPMAALVLRPAFGALSRRLPRFALLLGGILAAFGLLATMVKATNEPLVANNWLFYAPGEKRVGQWMNAHIQNESIWVDTWQHLTAALKYSDGLQYSRTIYYRAGNLIIPPPYILLAETTEMSANRFGFVLPAVYEHNKIYDNGAAQLYYRRAITPYQK
ncbi:MAG: hypothetical protein JW726_16050 [Anaerolineales bacterium]|nr:hypothetical protein [Anaerolineales bacterium]